jgi:hypothetical protein
MTHDTIDPITIVTLEWSYTPTDFFEVEKTIEGNGYVLVIGDGKAKANIQPDVYDQNPAIIDRIEQELLTRFRAEQLIENRSFQLSGKSNVTLQTKGGGKIIRMKMAARAITLTRDIDIIVQDADGNIITDTKQERINQKQRLSTLIAKHAPSDPTLDSMLKSTEKSFTDPGNLLIHLYEVRDALKKRFDGKEDRARIAIGISKNRWSELGRLANEAPLKQGRHRGSNVGNLRDATNEEIATARSIASEMIEKYVEWLEGQN